MKFAHSLTLGFLLALLLALPASAHSLLVRSSPESNAEMLVAPSTIDMWFSEPLESAFTGARLIGPSGKELATGAAVLDPSDAAHLTLPLGRLDPGIYTVAWQTLSQVDGHEWFGSFPITVLNPDGSTPIGSAAVAPGGSRGDLPSPGEVATRWLALVGSMLLFGGLTFRWLVVPDSQTPNLRLRSIDTILVVLAVSLVAIVLGSFGQVVLQSTRLGGLAEAPRLMVSTRTGTLVLGRILLALAGLTIALRLRRPIRRGQLMLAVLTSLCLLIAGILVAAAVEGKVPLPLIAILIGLGSLTIATTRRGERHRESALWVISSVLLISFSVSSHAGAVQGSLFAVLADLLHLSAAATWIGGLTLLPLIWVHTHGKDISSEFGIAVRRFSLVAGVAVFVILLTGLFNSLVELPRLESLWTTPYGLVLLAKIAIVLIALLVAFLNNRRVRRSDDSKFEASQIAVEAGLAAVILVVAAILVQTPTPRSLAISDVPVGALLAFNQITPTDDLNVHVQVDPNQAGKNRFWVHLYNDSGSEIGEVQLVRLFFEHAQQDLGRASVDLEPLGKDTFAAEGAYLSQSGQWDLSVYVRRRAIDDLLSDVRIDVPEGAGSQPEFSVVGNPIPQIPPQVLLGALLVVFGAVPILWRRQFQGELARTYFVGTVLIVVGGVALTLGVVQGTSAGISLSQRTNPVLPNSESIAQGRAIYTESCQICHGSTGQGDGPVGVTLNPRPANLVVHMVPGIHTDGQILEWISNGFPNSAMPGFAADYSEEELWHLINYTRTFGAVEDE